VSMQPTEEPFYYPPEHAQTAAVFGIASRHLRLDRPLSQLLSVRLTIVRAIRVHLLRPLAGPAYFPRHGLDRINNLQEFLHVRYIGRRYGRGQRDALRV